jgi:hypothetical protein
VDDGTTAIAAGTSRQAASDSEARRRQPLFVRESADVYVPTDAASGYWAPNTLAGSFVAGLLGHALEQAFGEPGMVPARFCVDFLKQPPKQPLTVVTRLVRGGGRLRMGEAELFAGDVLVAKANALFLRQTEDFASPVWQTPAWDAPPPEGLAQEPRFRKSWDMRPVPGKPGVREGWTPPSPEEQAKERKPWFLGGMAPIEARQAWARDERELVAGQPLTPFVRIALAADFVNPLANGYADGIDFINADLTVYLYRLPKTEWLGFELARHNHGHGLCLGEMWLHDEDGPIGSVTTTGIAQRRA